MTPTSTDPAAIACGRFGLGARPGELAQASSDPRGWLRAQVRATGADQPPGALPRSRDRLPGYRAALADFRELRRSQAALVADTSAGGATSGVDRPPPALVARLKRAWLDSRGDLGHVAIALVEAPEAWSPDARKFKRPYEFVVSSYRAVGAAPADAKAVVQPLTRLGERSFDAPQPNGWSDQAADWAAPTLDVRPVFKGVLQDHLGLERPARDTRAFPDNRAVVPVQNLV